MSPAVSSAIGSVHYSSDGTARFETEAEANEFIEAVEQKFPPIGYSTVARISLQAEKFTVYWRVYSAD